MDKLQDSSSLARTQRSVATWLGERRKKKLGLEVHGASSYKPADGLTILTTYFNPAHYKLRRQHFEKFIAPIRRNGMEHLIVECAAGNDDFELPPSLNVIQVRSRDAIWQKERLLNLALGHLSTSCRYVAWLDADLLFEDEEWAQKTCRLLEKCPVVQPYSMAILLERGAEYFDGEASFVLPSMAWRHGRFLKTLWGFRWEGHTGFAWAARRDLLDRHGFYATHVLGAGDHLMAHGFLDDLSAKHLQQILRTPELKSHFERWAHGIERETRGRCAAISGNCVHLWHGDLANRQCTQWSEILAECDFDPETDLKIGPSGCWEWASDKPELHARVAKYFSERHEDG